MGRMRMIVFGALGLVFVVLTLTGAGQQQPLRQNVEVLQPGAIRIDMVKEGLFVIRGPFSACMRTTCAPTQPSTP